MKTVLVYGIKNVHGGIENYLLNMQKFLCNDLRFIYLVERNGEQFVHEERIKGNNGEIVFLPDRHDFSSYRLSLHEVFRKLSDECDIFYANISQLSFDFIPIWIALNEGYKVVTHAHGAGQEPIKSIKHRILHGILRRIGKLILKYSNVNRLAVSERSGNYIFAGRKFRIVSPGIEVEKFLFNNQKREQIRTEISAEDCVLLGFAGRIVPVKNPLFLLEILSEFKKLGNNAKLLVLGDGELKTEMIQKSIDLYVSNDVIFMGSVNNVQDYLQAMDVLLAPSYSEGMPLGIMEAQSAGLPCICAKGNFPNSIDVTGIVSFCELSSRGDKWARTVRDIISSNIDRKKMNTIVKESVFNIQNASKKLLQELN